MKTLMLDGKPVIEIDDAIADFISHAAKDKPGYLRASPAINLMQQSTTRYQTLLKTSQRFDVDFSVAFFVNNEKE